jgi:hypothetical protein
MKAQLPNKLHPLIFEVIELYKAVSETITYRQLTWSPESFNSIRSAKLYIAANSLENHMGEAATMDYIHNQEDWSIVRLALLKTLRTRMYR